MDRLAHLCPIDGNTMLETRWLEEANAHRAECQTCSTVIYHGWNSEWHVDK